MFLKFNVKLTTYIHFHSPTNVVRDCDALFSCFEGNNWYGHIKRLSLLNCLCQRDLWPRPSYIHTPKINQITGCIRSYIYTMYMHDNSYKRAEGNRGRTFTRLRTDGLFRGHTIRFELKKGWQWNNKVYSVVSTVLHYGTRSSTHP